MADDWRKRQQERVNDKKDGASLKLEDGITCFRVMPDKKDLLPDGRLNPKGIQNSPVREFRMHRHWGPDDAVVTCGKDIDGKGRCWGCDEVIPKLEANPAKAAQARLVGPQEQFVIQASKFDTATQRFKLPKIMWLSTGAGIPGKPGSNTLALRVQSKIVGTRKDYIDPIKGYNLNIEKTGSGLKTRYPSVEGDESPTKVPLAVTAAVVSLDSLLPKYDEEDMKSLWFGRPRRDRNEGGVSDGASDEIDGGENPEPEYADGDGDAPMVDEYADDPVDDADPVPQEGDEPEYADEFDPDAPVDPDPDPDPEYAEDPDPEYAEDPAPEEFSNDPDPEDPPPARRPAPRPAARPAPPARPAARPAAPAARPAARPTAPPARPAARPAARPPAPPARRPAPATTKKPGRR